MGRFPLFALAVVCLFVGLWGGLLLLGLDVPAGGGKPLQMHGPLMVFGFLGTLVTMERAVALGRSWAYAAPLASAIGTLVALADPSGSLGPALLAFAGVVAAVVYVAIDRIQRSTHNAVMGLGGVAWIAAAVWWLAGGTVAEFAYPLAGFLVLTIVGERLELSRMVKLPAAARPALVAVLAAFAVGLAVWIAGASVGVRIAGAALLAQALWLARFDVARRTVRMTGLTRYMAVALLAGYVWMGVAGVMWLVDGPQVAGFAFDAQLHAVFLGFVISMVFAHAPVIFPAVSGVPVPYRKRYYAHLGLLHASLVLRLLGGDAFGDVTLWRWGGVLNEVAILLFLGSTVTAAIGARRGGSRPRPAVPRAGTPAAAVISDG